MTIWTTFSYIPLFDLLTWTTWTLLLLIPLFDLLAWTTWTINPTFCLTCWPGHLDNNTLNTSVWHMYWPGRPWQLPCLLWKWPVFLFLAWTTRAILTYFPQYDLFAWTSWTILPLFDLLAWTTFSNLSVWKWRTKGFRCIKLSVMKGMKGNLAEKGYFFISQLCLNAKTFFCVWQIKGLQKPWAFPLIIIFRFRKCSRGSIHLKA